MHLLDVHNCSPDVLSYTPLQVNGPGGPLMLLLNKLSGKTILYVYTVAGLASPIMVM